MSVCAEPRFVVRPVLRPMAELCALAALLAGLAALAPDHWRPAPAVATAFAPADEAEAATIRTLAEIRADPRYPDALWLDAREAAGYDAGHIPGALRFTEPEWEEHLPALLDRWQPSQLVVVYCDSAACGTSARIAARLRRELADEHIYALEGGWSAWASAP